MNREEIIQKLTDMLYEDNKVYAAWLEGSDANGNLDSYSDIDICILIDAQDIDSIFSKIQSQFEIDSIHENNNNNVERQLVFHIAGTDKYSVVDFNAYINGVADTTFVNGDNIDACKIIFDRCGVIQYKDYDPDECAGERDYWKGESEYRISQICRVEKYCLRGLYPEAFMYYHRYVIEALIFTLRIKYTPTKMWHYMVHISDHIPEVEVEKLNKILKVSSTDDILNNLSFAKEWYKELTTK